MAPSRALDARWKGFRHFSNNTQFDVIRPQVFNHLDWWGTLSTETPQKSETLLENQSV